MVQKRQGSAESVKEPLGTGWMGRSFLPQMHTSSEKLALSVPCLHALAPWLKLVFCESLSLLNKEPHLFHFKGSPPLSTYLCVGRSQHPTTPSNHGSRRRDNSHNG